VMAPLSEAELFGQFRSRGVSNGLSLYVPREAAFDFIRACGQNNLAVLGIEGLVLKDDSIHPRLDMIADYSPRQEDKEWERYRDMVNAAAEAFLNDMPVIEGLVFDFTLYSEREFELNRGRV